MRHVDHALDERRRQRFRAGALQSAADEGRPELQARWAALLANAMTDNGRSKSPAASTVASQATPERPASPQETKPAKPARLDGTVLRLSIDELVRLAPRLRGYLATPAPTWPDVVDAADWLRGELGVSKPLWGEACLAMGREEAAIADVAAL